MTVFVDDKGPLAVELLDAFADGALAVTDDVADAAVVVANAGLLPAELHAEDILLRLAKLDDVLDDKAADAALVLLSHFDVWGERKGLIVEGAADAPTYPRMARMGRDKWDVGHEREALRMLIDEVELRSTSADRVSSRLEHRRQVRKDAKEPSRGDSLHAALDVDADVERRRRLHAITLERARQWGFGTTRGYACALLEQTAATAVDGAVSLRLPPLSSSTTGDDRFVRAVREAQSGEGVLALYDVERALVDGRRRLRLQPTDRVWLCPVDKAAAAVVAAVTGAASGKLRDVVHVALEDTSSTTSKAQPFTAERLADLLDLAHRSKRARRGAAWMQVSQQLLSQMRANVDLETAESAAKQAAGWLSTTSLAKRAVRKVPKVGKMAAAVVERGQQELHKRVAGHDAQAVVPGGFTDEGLRLHARKLKRVGFDADISWRRYVLDVLVPTVRPLVEEDVRTQHRARPLAPYSTLLELVEELSEREGTRPALSVLNGNDKDTVRYQDLLPRAKAIAARLQAAGVEVGDRVLLSGQNHSDWALCAMGTAFAGAVLMPLDPALDVDAVQVLVNKGRPALALLDAKQAANWGSVLDDHGVAHKALSLFAAPGPSTGYVAVDVNRDDVASVLFTSGTTGEPKGVMLSHGNFTSLLSALGTVFDMHGDDRSLSLLPLHHTLEYSCGLWLPLSAGAEVHYLDELNAERLVYALQTAKVTGMVGVPALWQLLERKIRKQVDAQPPAVQQAFDLALQMNRSLGKVAGIDVGRVLFKPIHDELGGHLRTLISGGAALPAEVHALFQGLGLHLAEGYGLTETAPVLTVAEGKPGAKSGTVGHAIPGVELKLLDENEHGVGEVAAKAPNVMLGYFENDAATQQVFTDDGWFRTGDLGTFDDEGQLLIVGRAKDVVVTAAGENIYLDDVEATLGELPHVEEYTLLGIADPRGGERLALAAHAKEGERTQAEAKLAKALFKVPEVFRPQVVVFFDEALPRTATRKVKRKAVVPMVEAAQAERDAQNAADDEVVMAPVRQAVAMVAAVDLADLNGQSDLRADLGYDSLMWVELQDALEKVAAVSFDAEALFACRTVLDVERFVAEAAHIGSGPRRDKAAVAVDDDNGAWTLPSVVRAPLRKAVAVSQREVYRTVFSTEVHGRANIPFNRPTIVVANHTSHLDTGLVKFALGKYARDLAPLAAKDYFFEGNRLKTTLVENLTNLVPIERESGSGKAFEQAKAAVAEGKVVLIFPEGTRRAEGTLGTFKPLVGRLSLACDVDILPLYLDGAFEALPRGSSFPKARDLAVHIGPVLDVSELRRLTANERPTEQARQAASLAQHAIACLRDGAPLELSAYATVDDALALRPSTTTAAETSCG